MAHFAELDDNNIVLRVIVVANAECLDGDGDECEAAGCLFCERLYGGRWVQTSYNGTMRKRFAGVGFRYDESLDAFIPPQPYPSWSLDEETCDWEPPVAMPTNQPHAWDEQLNGWVAVDMPQPA